MPKLYDDLAAWWPLFSPPEDYAEEAEFYGAQLRTAGDAPCDSLLELGSGGGNNASFLTARFGRVTLVDPAPGMLAVSRRLNPHAEHVEGDMRTLRLGRTFDRVLIHDAICYMTTRADLCRAIETAYVHTRPGGAALFAPDHVRENFVASTDHGGVDGDGRGVRFLEWSRDPDPADETYTVDYAILLRDGDVVSVEHDRHIEGLFPRDAWLRMLADVGFEARAIAFDHSELEPGSYEVFVATKPHVPTGD
jgi:SAM-dependent methyltransferase